MAEKGEKRAATKRKNAGAKNPRPAAAPAPAHRAETQNENPDRYQFQWAGKISALKLSAEPPEGTLAPDLQRSVAPDGSQNAKQRFASRNIYIEAENLTALKIIARAYAGRVKMIYIDPPYNTGNDFVYNDKFAVGSREYMAQAGMLDHNGKASQAARDEVRKLNGHRHSAWLSMMFPRLMAARNLLAHNGVIFVSIDDNEVHHLRLVMNETFGAENFVAQIAWQGMDTVKNDARHFSTNAEFILAYAKDLDELEIQGIRKTEKQRATYKNRDNDPRGDYLLTPLHAKSGTASAVYDFTFPNGQTWRPPEGRYPVYSKSTLQRLVDEGRIFLDPKGRTTPQKKTYWSEASGRMRPTTFWRHEDFGSTRQANAELRALMGRGIFDNPKPVKLVKNLVDLLTEKDDLVMDFFSGSATTAHAVMGLNAEDGGKRRCVSVQFPQPTLSDGPARKAGFQTIADIGRERLIRAGRKIRESANGNIFAAETDTGFRFFRWSKALLKKWPHLTREDGKDKWIQAMLTLKQLPARVDPFWLLAEAMFQAGYPLCAEIEELRMEAETDGGKSSYRVFRVTDPERGRSFHFCTERKFPLAVVRALKLGREDVFFCREDALDDSLAMTLVRRLQLRTL